MVSILRFHCRRAQVQSLIGGLRFRMLRGAAKKKKKGEFYVGCFINVFKSMKWLSCVPSIQWALNSVNYFLYFGFN